MTIDPLQLAFLPQGNSQAMLDWLREHGDIHRRIAQEAIKRGVSNIATRQLYEVGNFDDWLFFHDAEHENISNSFNIINPPDLSNWNLEDAVNFNNWLDAHAITHDQIRKTLGL